EESYNAVIADLTANTQYHFRAAALSEEDVFGENLTFYTLAETPAAPLLSGAQPYSVSIALGTDANPAETVYAVRESNSGLYVQADGSLGATAVFQTAMEWIATGSVTGLTPNTNYVFDVKARNNEGVETAFGPSAAISTAALTDPTFTVSSDANDFGQVCYNSGHSDLVFALSGVNLTAEDIEISAPMGASVSLSADGPFVSSF